MMLKLDFCRGRVSGYHVRNERSAGQVAADAGDEIDDTQPYPADHAFETSHVDQLQEHRYGAADHSEAKVLKRNTCW